MSNPPSGSEIIRRIQNAAFDALVLGCEGILTRAQDRSNIKTGTLRRSGTVIPNRRRMLVAITFTASYFKDVHEGSPPHDIVVRDKKTLAVPLRNFFGTAYPYGSGRLPQISKDGGFVILGRRVRHPGYGGNPFLRETVEQYLPNVRRMVKRSVIRALNEGQ